MKILNGTITDSDITIEVSPYSTHVLWIDGTFSGETVGVKPEKSGGSYGNSIYDFTESEGRFIFIPSGRIKLSPSSTVSVTYTLIDQDQPDIPNVQPKEV